MAKTIKVKKGIFGGCRLDKKTTKAVRGEKITWEGQNASACIDFGSKENWPFVEPYKAFTVADGDSAEFTVSDKILGTEVEFDFDFACGTCPEVTAMVDEGRDIEILKAGAKIIIN